MLANATYYLVPCISKYSFFGNCGGSRTLDWKRMGETKKSANCKFSHNLSPDIVKYLEVLCM